MVLHHTCKDGQNGLVDGLDLACLHNVAGKEGDNKQCDENGQGP
jgi:hypothetical protein